MHKNIISNVLDNGVKIYIVPDNYIDYDYIIKFNNYGSNLDKHINIYGFQHLLEHCIFYNYKNLNIFSNASTCPTYMSIEFNIPHKNFDFVSLLKHWIFDNNNLKEISLVRNIDLKEINYYINELNSEYEFRNLLNIPWELQTFLLTNGQVHYFGGNNYTLLKKSKEIQKKLAKPVKIPPEDITIYIKKSKSNLYNKTRNLFSNLIPFKNNISITYDEKNFYGHTIQINTGNTNSLVFLIYKKKYPDVELLYYLKNLYPFLNFYHDDITNAYYIYFSFPQLNDLYSLYILLKHGQYDFLNLDKFNKYINTCIDVLNIDKIPENIIKYISNETYSSLYNKNKESIISFFKYLTELIEAKKYILNLTKQYMYNNITDYTKEKYYITRTNFLEDFFYSYYSKEFNVLNYLYYLKSSKKPYITNNKFFCRPTCAKINLLKNKDIKFHNTVLYLENSTKLDFTIYIKALINYFIDFTSNNLQDSINKILNNKILKNYSNHEIMLTNKIFKINTEYDFFFSVFKMQKNESKNVDYTLTNLEEFLKRNGICYYIESCLVKFNQFNILFIYTTINQNKFKNIINTILGFMVSNNYKLNVDIVLSYKSFQKNLSSVNKIIKCTF